MAHIASCGSVILIGGALDRHAGRAARERRGGAICVWHQYKPSVVFSMEPPSTEVLDVLLFRPFEHPLPHDWVTALAGRRTTRTSDTSSCLRVGVHAGSRREASDPCEDKERFVSPHMSWQRIHVARALASQDTGTVPLQRSVRGW